MNKQSFLEKLKDIQEIEQDEQDILMLERIKCAKDNAVITHDKLIKELDYSGKISLRVPKSLHKDLVANAKDEGISLNQFILYKLAK